jgi:methylmalonyl-CoA/ethylmalonyl-CoA epimerase
MANIKGINHIAVLVSDLDASLPFWRDGLGLELAGQRDVPAEMARIAFLPTGGSEIELVQPTTTDSGLARYLEKRGQGLHHICLEVDDLNGMLTRLKSLNVQLINEEPRVADDGRRYAFVHPKSAGGVMVELYEVQTD